MLPRLAILLSGNGSTYANLVAARDAGLLPVEFAVVISSRPGAYGLERARAYGHPTALARSSDEVTAALAAAGADAAAMCGWMRYYDPPGRMRGRVVNIHPSLLPAFGGVGMYGRHVHAAVIAAGCRETGCSVHLVEGAYDSGRILAQSRVPVFGDDTPERLQERVQAAERDLYPRTIAAWLADPTLAW
jgi:phosphoribosylglycinamide formyltransferase-1